ANQPAPEETASENPPPLPPPRPPRPPADSYPPGRLPVSTGHSLIGMAAEARPAPRLAGRPQLRRISGRRPPHPHTVRSSAARNRSSAPRSPRSSNTRAFARAPDANTRRDPMLINNEFEVAAPVEQVWQLVENIPQVAACLPGAELTEDLGDDTYKGKVAVRMGPVQLQFAEIGRAHA